MNWPDDVRSRVDDYLDRVERALASRLVPRSDRRSIVDEIETQIETLVSRRTDEGAKLNVVLIEEILQRMDPAESYGEGPERTADAEGSPSGDFHAQTAHAKPTQAEVIRPQVPRRDPVAIAALLLWGFVVLTLMTGAERLIVFCGMPAALVATGLAIWSIYRIRNSDGWLHGLGWAFGAACILPVLMIQWFLWLFAETPLALVLMVTVFLAVNIYVHYRVISAIWRRVSEGYQPRPMPPGATTAPRFGQGISASF
ncbi:MAG: hypothetical protein U0795_19455 [Pirellulales bacterium]